MTRHPRARYVLAAGLMLCLLTAGCNVYEGLYEEGNSDDPEVLLEDARIALQRNEPVAAVDHLRRALDQAGHGTVVRKRVQIKLASAVLLTQQIDALSLSQLARTFSGEAASFGAGKSDGPVCNFPAEHEREAFDPAAGIDFDRLGSTASQNVREEAATLISSVFTGQETTAEHDFPCDPEALDAAVAKLQDEGLTDAEIAEALVDYAVVLSTGAYLDVVAAGGDQVAFFYARPPGSNADYVGTCFPDADTCQATLDQTAATIPHLDCSTRLLAKRAELLGSQNAAELAALAQQGVQALGEGLDAAQCISY